MSTVDYKAVQLMHWQKLLVVSCKCCAFIFFLVFCGLIMLQLSQNCVVEYPVILGIIVRKSRRRVAQIFRSDVDIRLFCCFRMLLRCIMWLWSAWFYAIDVLFA